MIVNETQYLYNSASPTGLSIGRDDERMTLDQLREGQRGRVVGVDGNDALAMRLLEMGITEGQEVHVLGFAPFGDPVEVEVRGYRLSLRTAEARRIQVQPIETSDAGSAAQ